MPPNIFLLPVFRDRHSLLKISIRNELTKFFGFFDEEIEHTTFLVFKNG
jgi:hypothetical protein